MTRRAGKRWLWALALLLLFLAAAWFTECSPARFWARRGHLTDLISAMFPPDWGYTSRILTPLLATVQMSVTGTALGAFLILFVSPMQAVWFVVFIVVLQQVDNNLIYPRVVGKSVGLPGLWVLIAVTVGGGVGGVFGMVASVPTCSVLYTLVREAVDRKSAEKAAAEAGGAE